MSTSLVLGAGAALRGAVGATGSGGAAGPVSPNPSPPSAAFQSLLAAPQLLEAVLSPRHPAGDSLVAGPEVLAAFARLSPGPALGRPTERSSGIKSPRGAASDEDPLDPLQRHRAALQVSELLTPGYAGMPSAPASAPAAADRPIAAVSLEELLPALVRRVAWSGDGLRGTARLEIGAGELAGATLLVAADAGRVRVHLQVPAGVDAAAWQDRIRRRLESRSIVADSVEVA